MQVRIPPLSMAPSNLQVRARQVWGNDVYTEDSDVVAVLMHTGYYSIAQPHAPVSIAEVDRTSHAALPHEHRIAHGVPCHPQPLCGCV